MGLYIYTKYKIINQSFIKVMMTFSEFLYKVYSSVTPVITFGFMRGGFEGSMGIRVTDRRRFLIHVGEDVRGSFFRAEVYPLKLPSNPPISNISNRNEGNEGQIPTSFMPDQTKLLPGMSVPTLPLLRWTVLTLGTLTLLKQVYEHPSDEVGYCNVKPPKMAVSNSLAMTLSEPRDRSWCVLYLAPTRVFETTFFLEDCARRVWPDFEDQNWEEKEVSLTLTFYDFKYYNNYVYISLQYVINITSAFILLPYVRFATLLVLEKHIVVGSSIAAQAALLLFSVSVTQSGLQLVSFASVIFLIPSLSLLSSLRRVLKDRGRKENAKISRRHETIISVLGFCFMVGLFVWLRKRGR